MADSGGLEFQAVRERLKVCFSRSVEETSPVQKSEKKFGSPLQSYVNKAKDDNDETELVAAFQSTAGRYQSMLLICKAFKNSPSCGM